MSFADRVIEATRRHGPLCVGIDPHAGRIPALFGGDTPAGLAAWGMALVDLAAGRVGAIKPQVALFERHGPEGMAALQAVCARASEAGLIVIADAKRGDIGTTAKGYAAAWLAADAPFAADAITLNPYMGYETLDPFIELAARTGKGVAVLARTSNPGASDIQALSSANRPVFLRVVDGLAERGTHLTGASGWSGLMLVAGATGPQEARAIRAAAPHALLLVPGYGAQGAGAREALAGFVPGPAGLEGGLVNASRTITFPPGAEDAATFRAWQTAIGDALEAARADLNAASSTT